MTFAVVRNMSGIVSAPNRIPSPSTGRPASISTGAMMMIDPPGIPGTLKLVRTTVSTTLASCAGPRVTPYNCAMKTTPTVWPIAVPMR